MPSDYIKRKGKQLAVYPIKEESTKNTLVCIVGYKISYNRRLNKFNCTCLAKHYGCLVCCHMYAMGLNIAKDVKEAKRIEKVIN